jgi:hypothetical protein
MTPEILSVLDPDREPTKAMAELERELNDFDEMVRSGRA